MSDSNLPFITICMPLRNEERFVGSTLEALLNQDYPANRFEMIVADGQSTDRTREIVEKIADSNPQITLLTNPGCLPSSGRNVGFRNGKGDIFLVIDGHCRIDNDHILKNLAECFERSRAQCMGRPQPFVIPEEPNVQRAIGLARTSWLGHSLNSYIHSNKEGYVSPISVGCAYKREIFEKIGFVDESFDACEDVEFNYRVEKAGFKTFFSPKITIQYYPRETLSGLCRQLIRYGMGRFNFMFKHPETINVEMFLPSAFVIGIVLGPLLGFIHNYFWLGYISVLLLYLVIVSLESARLGLNMGLVFSMKLIVTFLIIHGSLGVGIIRGAWHRILPTPPNKRLQ
jgi:glycosyltransferase involved in cell wall biosynthesis